MIRLLLNPLLFIASILDKLDKLIFRSERDKFDLPSGVIATARINKYGKVTNVYLCRDWSRFEKLNWRDTSALSSFPRQHLDEFQRRQELNETPFLPGFSYNEKSGRLVYNNDGELFSISTQDVASINRWVKSLEVRLENSEGK